MLLPCTSNFPEICFSRGIRPLCAITSTVVPKSSFVSCRLMRVLLFLASSWVIKAIGNYQGLQGGQDPADHRLASR